MKVCTIFQMCVVACIIFLNQITALSPTSAQRLEDAPQCAIDCLVDLMDQPISSFANNKRLCHEKKFGEIVTICVRNGCSVRHFLGKNADIVWILTEDLTIALLSQDQAKNMWQTRGITVFSVAARVLTKINRYTRWGPDDSLIIASLVFSTVQCVVMNLMTSKGLGRNIWTLDDNTITTFFIFVLIIEYAYVLNLCLIKLSILCFLLRTFPDPGFRKVIKWTIGFTILTAVIISICAVCYRQPIWLLWKGWKEDPHHGVVMDKQAIVVAHAVINVALDVWMFILPLTQLYRLGLKLRKKAGVVMIFSVGIFLIAVSCIRIPYMLGFDKSVNATTVSQRIIIWSNIETGVGTMVACMPHAQSLLRAVMARVKCMNVLSIRSSSTEGIFVDRPLATIKATHLDRTTEMGPDDLVLYDRGRLLSLDVPKHVGMEDGHKSGCVTHPGTSV